MKRWPATRRTGGQLPGNGENHSNCTSPQNNTEFIHKANLLSSQKKAALPPPHPTSASMTSDGVRGSNIQFKFRKAWNIHRKNGEAPNAAVYAKYITDDTGKKGKTERTALRKGYNPIWDENINMNMQRDNGVSLDTKVTFFVVDQPSSIMALSFTKVARSKQYTISELLALRDAEEPGKEGEEGFSVPLENETSKPDHSPASLVLSLRDFWSVDDKKVHHDKVKTEWKARNREDLNNELDNLRRELTALTADLPIGTNSKTLTDIALGSLNLLVSVIAVPEIHDDRAVISLLSSHCMSMKKIRENGPHHSPDAVLELYGGVCSKIIISLRALSQLSANGLKLELARRSLLNQVSKDTQWFDAFTGASLKEPTSKPRERANRRKNLTASEPQVTAKLNPIFEMEPPKTDKIRPRNSSSVAQLVASWAFATPGTDLPRLLWLYGGQECGKTQFARGIVDAFGSLDVFPAYFSFAPSTSSPIINSNGNGSNTNSNLTGKSVLHSLVATLAFQLAAYDDRLTAAIVNAVRNSPPLEETPFEDALKRLIVDPLSTSLNTPQVPGEPTPATPALQNPVLIVLDDVDQSSPADLTKLIAALAASVDKLPKAVRVLALSRELAEVKEALGNEKLAQVSEFGGGGLGGSPMSPLFSPLRATNGAGGSLDGAVSGGAGGGASRSPSITWSTPSRHGSTSTNGSGKGKKRSSTGSVRSLESITEASKQAEGMKI